MIKFNDREQIIALTPQWKGERFPDGRPRVADKYLEKNAQNDARRVVEAHFRKRLRKPV